MFNLEKYHFLNIVSVDHVYVTIVFFSPLTTISEGKMFQSQLATVKKKPQYILLIDAYKSNQFI